SRRAPPARTRARRRRPSPHESSPRSSSRYGVALHAARVRPRTQLAVLACDRGHASERPRLHDGHVVPARDELPHDVPARALLDRGRARLEAAWEERPDQMPGVELRRVDRLLEVETAVDVPQENVQRPLLLLVAAGRSVREPRLAAAENETGRERR